MSRSQHTSVTDRLSQGTKQIPPIFAQEVVLVYIGRIGYHQAVAQGLPDP